MTWPELVAQQLAMKTGENLVLKDTRLDCVRCGAWACVTRGPKGPDLCLSCWYQLVMGTRETPC